MSKHPFPRPMTGVYWLGGSVCAGKTTLADRLSSCLQKQACLQAHVYHCDDFIGAHFRQADPKRNPTLTAAARLSFKTLLGYSTAEYLDLILQVYREEFEMVMADLQRIAQELPEGAPIIAEGINLLPDLVAQVAEPRSVIYLIATPEHYRAHQSLRPEFTERINSCPDPETARESYIAKDLALARHIATRCQSLNLKSLLVSPESRIEENLEVIVNHFGLSGEPKRS